MDVLEEVNRLGLVLQRRERMTLKITRNNKSKLNTLYLSRILLCTKLSGGEVSCI